MSPRLKKIIENRFPENTILDEEFLVGYDGKLRYPEDVRACLYRKLTSWIREYSKNIPLYLCMEEKSLHRE
jgi:spore photoproduct lyase